MKILYCPVCGSEVDTYTKKCTKCSTDIKPVESQYELKDYMDKSTEKYGHPGNMFKILNETEIFVNPHFNQEEYKKARSIIEKQSIETFHKINDKNKNIPKCPTCQSVNIKKISATKKVTHGLTFGLFSKTARSQFECNNCGYKW